MDPLARKVAARFRSAAAMPSKAALGFLTKAAKGIKGGIDPEAMTEALTLLGWAVEELIVPTPVDGEKATGILRDVIDRHGTGMYGRPLEFIGGLQEEAVMYVSGEEQARAVYRAVKAAVMDVPRSGPSSLGEGELAIHGLDVLGSPRWLVAFSKAWYGVQGWRVVNDRGGSVVFTPKLTYRGRIEPITKVGPDRFWTFAYKSGLKDQAKAFLDGIGAEVVENVLRPVDMRSMENTGTCPACFVNVKLIKGRIIRHGWRVGGQRQRGVHGGSWHSGPCFGVGYEPFEISPKGTEEYVKSLEPIVRALKARLAHLDTRPDLSDEDRHGRVRVYRPGDSNYEAHLKSERYNTQGQLDRVQAERETCLERVRGWRPRPLPGTK